MSSERLLLWISARQQGTIGQFYEAVRAYWEPRSALGERMPPRLCRRLLYDLDALAHLELDNAAAGGWRVTPPTIVSLPSGDGLLCGYRSAALTDALAQVLGPERIRETLQAYGPARLVLGQLSGDEQRAIRHALNVEFVCGNALLRALAPIAAPRPGSHVSLPSSIGWEIHRFSVTTLAWVPFAEQGARGARSGLYRWRSARRTYYYTMVRGAPYRIALQDAKYLQIAAAKRQVVRYDGVRQTLAVPAICRLPRLLQRAVVLSSGILPVFNEQCELEYSGVTPEVASAVRQLLKQRTA